MHLNWKNKKYVKKIKRLRPNYELSNVIAENEEKELIKMKGNQCVSELLIGTPDEWPKKSGVTSPGVYLDWIVI